MPEASPPHRQARAPLAIPMAEAKNRLSSLVARAERGEEIAITRRGVSVARLVPEPGSGKGLADRRKQVDNALQRLRQLGADVQLEGDLRTLARQGLDG
ncbi:MAG: type II toxin-antitoxin system Phd/YefM family antitoxin [Cyanobium sp.]